MPTYTIRAGTPILSDQKITEDNIIIEDKADVKARLFYTSEPRTTFVQGLFKEYGFGNQYTNSYVTIDETTQYLNILFMDWADVSDADKLKHILSGTRYIERNFKFVDRKNRDFQSLSFPRVENGTVTVRYKPIPYELKKACMEAAYLDFKADLNPLNTTQAEAAREIIEETDKVGPLITTIKYSKAQDAVKSGDKETPSYNFIKSLLGDLVYQPKGITQLKVDSGL